MTRRKRRMKNNDRRIRGRKGMRGKPNEHFMTEEIKHAAICEEETTLGRQK